MPRYVIERNFAEQLDLTKDGVEKVNLINDQEGRAVDLLFPQRRQEKDLLSLRRAQS